MSLVLVNHPLVVTNIVLLLSQQARAKLQTMMI